MRQSSYILNTCVLLLMAITSTWGALLTELLREARAPDVQDFMLSCRQHLHQYPELQLEEFNSSAYIRAKLDELGIPYRHPFAGTGLTAVIGATSGPMIALRADMDALPIEEASDLPEPRSRVPGVMHACGHDAHMSMLLGAAKMLKAREGSLPGRVLLLFQPAEEGMGGANLMVQQGALQGAQAVAGLHVWPMLPGGTIATRAHTILAASDRFTFEVLGQGGHGALPHLTKDPVVAASAIVMALQTLVSRETSPTDGAVVTVSRFNTGPGAANVIPDRVEIQGTVRALTQAVFDELHQRIEQVVQSTAAVFRCQVHGVTWSKTPYPPTVNDPQMAAMVSDLVTAAAADGDEGNAAAAGIRFQPLAVPGMAAEDFAFYGREVPAVFTFLGIGNSSLGTDMPLHNPRFLMDDAQMPLGAALHVATALQYLSMHAGAAHPGASSSQVYDEL